jgi:branched-chain amino acid transport system permease protein
MTGSAAMTSSGMSSLGRLWPVAGLALLAIVPLTGVQSYVLHILILILLWSFIYTGWSLMGRFGLVSLGHGAFLGIGVYSSGLLWNHFAVTPWLGIPLGVVLAVAAAVVIGYPCFRLKVVGHYFALVTLAMSEVARLTIIAWRDVTSGSLGMTLNAVPSPSVSAIQFADKTYFFYISLGLWLIGLYVWHRVDRSMAARALDAISEDEVAAAAVGIDVTGQKMRVTMISAALTAVGGSMLGQYLMYVNPETLSGIGVSLQIVFAAIAGGMYSLLGPTVGAVLTICLTEGLRILFGTSFVGAANTIYGILLVLFIIYMPRGLVGLMEGWRRARPS